MQNKVSIIVVLVLVLASIVPVVGGLSSSNAGSVSSTSSVEIEYTYSKSLDMAVSNWDPDIGNYLYYNQLSSASMDAPYASTPDWESASPDYSTGAQFADINNDGWLDLVVSDGNDMGMGHVNVYLNDGNGALSTTASWQSSDVAYNGHLDVADVNGDGWQDVAVSYLGSGGSTGPVARVYLNNEGTLSSTADWNAALIAHAFGVDFGDMNNDGRPDLAVATGDSYAGQGYHTLVYLNYNGTYSTTPSWQSSDDDIMMAVHWVDVNGDGWLDLVGSPSYAETRVYRNLGGVLETTASWHTTDSADQFGNILTSGDVNSDGFPDLFTVDNTQLGGSGLIKQYVGLPDGFFEQTASWTYYTGYGSAVELADVNYDNKLDLAAGAWWDHTWVFLNTGTGMPSSPSWTSGGTSVVEKIVFGNVGPTQQGDQTITEVFNSDRNLFYLQNKNIQWIDSVTVNGVALDPSQYMYSRDQGFVTIGVLSPHHVPDLHCTGSLSWSDIKPGSTVQGSFTVSNVGDSLSLLNWKVDSHPTWGTWTFTPSSGTGLTPENGPVTVSVTVTAPDQKKATFTGDVKIINTDNASDYEFIHVSLVTPTIYRNPHPMYLKTFLSYLAQLKIFEHCERLQNLVQWMNE